MKNYYKFALSFVLIFTISLSAQAQDVISKKQSKFVSKFVGGVNLQKKKKVYKMVSKEYKAKIKGSRDLVLSNLMAGRIKKTDEFSKVPFNKIYNMRLTEVRELQENITLYNFILVTPEGPVDTSLILRVTGKKGKFSFEAAQN